jgi:hypothetical protein
VTFSRQSTHSTFSFVLVYPLCHPSKQKISEHNYSIDDDECPPPRSTFAFPVSMNLLFERSYCQRTWIHNFASQINSIDSLSMHVCRAKLGKGDRERFVNFSSAVTAGVSKSLPSSLPLSRTPCRGCQIRDGPNVNAMGLRIRRERMSPNGPPWPLCLPASVRLSV